MNISELGHYNPGDVDITCFNSTSSQLQTIHIQMEVTPRHLPSWNPLTTDQPFSLLFEFTDQIPGGYLHIICEFIATAITFGYQTLKEAQHGWIIRMQKGICCRSRHRYIAILYWRWRCVSCITDKAVGRLEPKQLDGKAASLVLGKLEGNAALAEPGKLDGKAASLEGNALPEPGQFDGKAA